MSLHGKAKPLFLTSNLQLWKGVGLSIHSIFGVFMLSAVATTKVHSLRKQFCKRILFSDSWCQLWQAWKGLVRWACLNFPFCITPKSYKKQNLDKQVNSNVNKEFLPKNSTNNPPKKKSSQKKLSKKILQKNSSKKIPSKKIAPEILWKNSQKFPKISKKILYNFSKNS